MHYNVFFLYKHNIFYGRIIFHNKSKPNRANAMSIVRAVCSSRWNPQSSRPSLLNGINYNVVPIHVDTNNNSTDYCHVIVSKCLWDVPLHSHSNVQYNFTHFNKKLTIIYDFRVKTNDGNSIWQLSKSPFGHFYVCKWEILVFRKGFSEVVYRLLVTLSSYFHCESLPRIAIAYRRWSRLTSRHGRCHRPTHATGSICVKRSGKVFENHPRSRTEPSPPRNAIQSTRQLT